MLRREKPSVHLAAFWMSGALLSFVGMALAGRELAQEASLFEILFLRNILCLIMIVILLYRLGPGVLKTNLGKLHILRNSIHYAASFFWYFGIISIPLAEVFAIEFTAPIWTAIFAAFFLNEKMNRFRFVSIVFGFIGVLVILRPGLAIIDPASFIVLVAAIGYGSVYAITRHMAKTEKALVILFYMNFVQALIGLVPTVFTWVTPSVKLWPWVFLLGLVGLTSHYCIARAMAYADAAVVATLDFLRLPLIAFVGYLLYNEPLDILVVVGALLVFSGNFLNIVGEKKTSK